MRTKLGYQPALDGLRAAAVLAVLAAHAKLPHLSRGGDVGVNTFFVLSGFLITALMVEERTRTRTVHLGYFYARRALRLFPALFTAALVFAVFVAVFPGSKFEHRTITGLPAVLLYYGNWARANDGGALGLFSHTWSLAIEEQFYLVWPLVFIVTMKLTRSYKVLAGLTLGLAAVSTVWRFRLWNETGNVVRVVGGSDTRAASLLMGCALGILVMRRPFRVPTIVGWASLFVLAVVCVAPVTNRYTYYLTVLDIAGLGIIATLVTNPGLLGRCFAAGPAVAIGRISYGLYVWHYPTFILFRRWDAPRPVVIVVEFAAAFALAILSYRFVERPALRLKNRLARREQIASIPPA